MRTDIISIIQTYKERNMKPNFSRLAAEYDIDRRTVKKYYDNPKAERKKREYRSPLEDHDQTIREKARIPGMTFAGIYWFLRNERGLKLSYNSLTGYCRKHDIRLAGTKKGPHVRYTTPPGRQVQVDWKEDLTLHTRSGEPITFNVYSATLGFSRKHLFIYSRTKTEQDFIRCTNEMIRMLGGAPEEILTDNMAAIVSIAQEGRHRRKHQNVLQWEKDSGIRIRLCKPRTPETKGKDESANRFVNRILAYDNEVGGETDVIDAIAKIQNDSNDKVNDEIGMSPEALFCARERQSLGRLPNMSLLDSYLDGGQVHRVQSTLLVPFQGRWYSVPAEYLGRRVRILRDGDEIRIYSDGSLVAAHRYVEGKRINYDKEHYMQGLEASVGRKDLDLDSLAEENLKGFDAL